MSLYQPLGLLVLLVVPLVGAVVWWWLWRRPARYAVRFTNVEVVAAVVDRGGRWRRLLPGLLFALCLCSAGVAVARPYRRVLVPVERASVVLVFDVSGSMRARDIAPSRLGAAQQAARVFLSGLPPRVRVGVIAFSSEPEVVAPPTVDRRLVREAIAALTPGGATAIGDALAVAVRMGERAVAPGGGTRTRRGRVGGLASIVLLSDGRQDSGVLQSVQAARLARAAGIPVYTVGLGSPRGAPLLTDTGLYVIAGPDVAALRAIATTTGGRFTAAATAATLRRAYTRLGQQLGRTPGREEISSLFAGTAALFLVGAIILGALWAPRLP